MGIVKGKLAYMSPEQITGQSIDRRSDVFSLAATLYELSTDQRLFKRDADEDTIRAVRDALVPDPTSSVPDYPSLLWLVLRRALARDAADRYATAQELARDLDGVARAQGSIIQTATLAEIMGELYGKDRVREISLLRAGSPRIAQARALPNPSIPETQQAPAAAVRDRRVRSPYLIATTTEPSIITPILQPTQSPRRRSLSRFALVTSAAAFAIITVVAFGWSSCRTARDDARPTNVGSRAR
jgi:serine/threonine protein kinase